MGKDWLLSSSNYKLNTNFSTKFLSFTLVACVSVMGLSFFGLGSTAYATCNPCITFDNSQFPNNKYFEDHGMIIAIQFDTAQSSPLTVTIESHDSSPTGSLIDRIDPTFTSTDGKTFTLPSSWVYLYAVGTNPPNTPAIKFSNSNTVIVVKVNGVTASTGIQDPNFNNFAVPPTTQPDLTATPTCASDFNYDGICDNWVNSNGMSITSDSATYTYVCDSSIQNKVPTSYVGLGTSSNPDPVCPTISTQSNPGKKDIFVEVDWLPGHQPSKSALDALVQTFNSKNIQLHIQLDDNIPFHKDIISPPSNGNAGNTDFDNLKKAFFGTADERNCSSSPPIENHCTGSINNVLTAKRLAFHYAIFAHSQQSGSSGTSETPGNDIMISLGGFKGGSGDPSQQTGTFMHEIGHNLGLLHGGVDNINCKPNYPSVMSYTFQMPTYTGTNWVPQYSNGVLNGLYEISLSENTGLWSPSPAPFWTFWYSGSSFPLKKIPSGGSSVDWNWNGILGEVDSIDVDNLNIPGCTSAPYTTLVDYNDWHYAEYNMWNPSWMTSSMQDGAGP